MAWQIGRADGRCPSELSVMVRVRATQRHRCGLGSAAAVMRLGGGELLLVMTGPVVRLGLALLLAGLALPARAEPAPAHALAMLSEPKYGPDFTHFDYVDPNAPKGGTLVLSAIGHASTASIPTSCKGIAGGRASLAVRDPDRAVAGRAVHRVRPDRRDHRDARGPLLGRFTLRPEARWHDGQPITADDVIFSFETLRPRATRSTAPTTPTSAKAEAAGERQVQFTFDAGRQPRAAADRGPAAGAAQALLREARLRPRRRSSRRSAAAPYRIKSFEPGRSITYERVRGLLGRGSAGQPRPQQLRRDPLRLLPRRRRRARGVQGRASTTSASRTRPSSGPRRYDRPGVRRAA